MTNGRLYLKRKQFVLCWLSQRLYNITKVYFLPYCIHHAFKIKCAVFMNNNAENLMDLIIYSILWVTKFPSCCFCFTVFARSCEEIVLRRNYVSVFIVIMGHSGLPSAVIWWFFVACLYFSVYSKLLFISANMLCLFNISNVILLNYLGLILSDEVWNTWS